ncbi:MAG: choice-of-anchor U domain-containing protein [Microthrixaceae bacterium]
MGNSRTPLGAVLMVLALFALGCVPQDPAPAPPVTDSVVVNGQVVSASVPTGLSLSIEQAEPAAYPLVAADFDFGALDIEVGGLAPGSAVRVSVMVPSPVDTVRKLIGGEWLPFPFDGDTGARISADGRTVTVDLRDGGRGDLDGMANGVVIDPLALGSDVGAVPTMTFGEPFTHQLQATGGVGPIQWSVLSGNLPPGITLDSSGLLSGTPTGNGSWVRVQAADGTSTATQVLALSVLSTNVAISTGAALPEGSNLRIAVANGFELPPPGGSWVGDYGPTGSLSRLASASIATAPGIDALGPLATNLPLAFTSPAVSPDGATAVVGDLVMDAQTGETIATLDLAQPVSWGGAWFSPSGAFVAVRDITASLVRIFTTSTWSEVRTIASSSGSTGLIWSPDSTELIVDQPALEPGTGLPGGVQISSATSPVADRSVTLSPVLTLPGAPDPVALVCRNVLDWSVTGRLALSCGLPPGLFGLGGTLRSVVTASASDGSDTRIVAPTAPGTSGSPTLIYGGVAVRFSPSGSRLVFDELQFGANPSLRLVVATDSPSSEPTPLTTLLPSTAGIAVPLSWTGGGSPVTPPPTTTTTTTTTTTPPVVPNDPMPLAVSQQGARSCAIGGGGSVKCWGPDGPLATAPSFSTTAVEQAGVNEATAVALSENHACALVAGGRVNCWGKNSAGQLGNGTFVDSSAPVEVLDVDGVTPLTGATAITAHGGAGSFDLASFAPATTCAVVAGGRVKCWGQGPGQPLGQGTATGSNIAVDVLDDLTGTPLTGAIAIDSDEDHLDRVCALISGGTVKCWRWAFGGGSATVVTESGGVTPLTDVTAIAVRGVYDPALCVATTGGTVRCGETFDSLFTTVSGVTGATAISSSWARFGGVDPHTCAIVELGRVVCWGGNSYGQLGRGFTSFTSESPGEVNGISGATAISVGLTHGCALLAGGSVECWGLNHRGQLGNGTIVDSDVPVGVLNLP